MADSQVAAGSVQGRLHREAGKNNQDAFYLQESDDVGLYIVCDGCSEGKHSEVGAKLIARWVVQDGLTHALHHTEFKKWSNLTRWSVLVKMDQIARGQSQDSSKQVLLDYFLTTVLGALVTPETTYIFGVGDGVYAINGEVQEIKPFAGNKPAYLAFELMGSSLPIDALEFQLHAELPTDEVESVFVGTDGVLDWIRNEDTSFPGTSRPLGPLSQFWQDDRIFDNADEVRRRLAAANRIVKKPNWGKQEMEKYVGLLPDDTTLIALRRQP